MVTLKYKICYKRVRYLYELLLVSTQFYVYQHP